MTACSRLRALARYRGVWPSASRVSGRACSCTSSAMMSAWELLMLWVTAVWRGVWPLSLVELGAALLFRRAQHMTSSASFTASNNNRSSISGLGATYPPFLCTASCSARCARSTKGWEDLISHARAVSRACCRPSTIPISTWAASRALQYSRWSSRRWSCCLRSSSWRCRRRTRCRASSTRAVCRGTPRRSAEFKAFRSCSISLLSSPSLKSFTNRCICTDTPSPCPSFIFPKATMRCLPSTVTRWAAAPKSTNRFTKRSSLVTSWVLSSRAFSSSSMYLT
mmetsp:Transcript_51344/g.135315  ORF Transcript_51344/g.135315 Transcript_51344/m.135315 type:complete len:281 (-) Transcript_51344:113-955(-)